MNTGEILDSLNESSNNAEIVSALLDCFFVDNGVHGGIVLARIGEMLRRCRPEEVRARNPKGSAEVPVESAPVEASPAP